MKPMVAHKYDKNVTAPNNDSDNLNERRNNVCMEYIQTVEAKGKTKPVDILRDVSC